MDEALLRSMTDTIVDALHPDEVILFGSRARADAGPESDVDLLVIVPDSDDAKRHRRQMTGQVYRRLAHYPVAKDILLYTRSEVEHWRGVSGHIVDTSLREGRRLYARS